MKKTVYFTLLLVTQFGLFGQNSKLDSLKIKLSLLKNDSAKIAAVNYCIDHETDMTVWGECYNILIQISGKHLTSLRTTLDTFYHRNYATSLNNKASINQIHGDIINSLELFNQALVVYEKLGDKKNYAACLINIGGTYDNQGDLNRALDYYHQSLKILEVEENIEALIACYINIGNVYKKLNDHEAALRYYQKSLLVSEKNKDKNGIAHAYNFIGIIYQIKGNKTEALDYFYKSLKIKEELNDLVGISQCYNNIGTTFKRTSQLPKAINFFNKSLDISMKLLDKKAIANTLDNLAQCYLEINDLVKAYGFAKQGFDTAVKITSPKIIMNSANTLKRVYEKQQNYKLAYEMFNLEIKMRDSMNNKEVQKLAIRKDVQYIYEKKELEAKLAQEKKDLVTQQQLKQREKERNYFIVGFILVLILILFMYRNYKQKQKANKIILHQKYLVEEKQREILDSIHYAKRIQLTMLPNENLTAKKIEELRRL
jgi:tetratricopeptide (TPR) repeat protein